MKNTRKAARVLSFVTVLAVLLSFSALLGVTSSAEDVATEETTTDELWLYDYEGKQLGTDYAYSFAVIGDTQVLNLREVNYGTQSFSGIYDWIIANKDEKNIQRVIGLGDITDATLIAEYANAEREFAKLAAAGIPYSFIRGNHDATTDAQVEQYATDRKDANGNPFTVEDGIKFQDALTWAEYGSTVDGSYAEDMINTYQKFEVGEVKYLLLNVDYGPSDEVIAWMNDVISSNSDRYVIIATHIYLKDDASYSGTAGYGGNNSSQTLWDDCIKRHENVVLVLSGHHPSDTLVVREELGVYNNKVTAILVDPQGTDKTYIAEGGAGLVAMFYFSEDGKTMDIEYYSTVKDAHFMAENQISSLKIVLDEDEKPKTTYVSTSEELLAAMKEGGDVTLLNNIEFNPSATATRLAMLGPIAPLTIRSGEGGPYTLKISDSSKEAGFAGRWFLANAGAQPVTFLDVIFDGNGVVGIDGAFIKFNNSAEGTPSVINLGSPDEPGLIPEFRNFNGGQGGVFYFGKYNEVNVYGAKFYNNTATTAGSDSIYAYLSALNVHGTLYTEADSIYNKSSTMTLAKGAQVMASVTDGASLTAAMAGTLDWAFFVANSDTVTDNGAAFGAAVLNDITFDGAETVSVAETKVLDGLGHTVYRSASAVGVPMFTVAENAKLTLTNITLDGNGVADTTTNGGAFKLESGSALTLTGAGEEAPVIRGFSAGMGGAIYSSGALTIENAYIQQNTASSNGGGIYLKGGTFTMNGGLIGGEGLGNVGKCGGGIAIAMSGAVAINGGEISYNSTSVTDTADYHGGGIYTTASADNVTISGTAVICHNTAYQGGGIYALGNMTFAGSAKVSENLSVSHGGGIYASKATVLLTENSEIYKNQGNRTGNTTYGGGIYITGGTLTLSDNAKIWYNGLTMTTSNQSGCAVYASASTILIEDNAVIEYNKALGTVNEFGGAIYMQSGTLIMTGGKISNNGGGGGNSSRAGAIYMAGTAPKLWLLGGEISNNCTKGQGGAIYNAVADSTVYILGGQIKDNAVTGTSSNRRGSAINMAAGTLYILGGEISGHSFKSTPASPTTFYLNGATAVLGSSVEATIPDAVKNSGLVGISGDGKTVTSLTPLIIENNGSVDLMGYYTASDVNTFNVTLAEDLVAGSRVVFGDNAKTEGYFLTLAENYTPNTATLNAIELRGADALYNAKVEGATLVWPSDAYQVIRSAALSDTVDFRLTVVFRDKTARQTVTATMNDMYVANIYTATVGDDASCVVIPMAPKYITEKVTLNIGSEKKEYTLADYLTDLTTPEYAYLGFADLAQALINYGSAAQVYLAYNTSNLANDGYKTAFEEFEVTTTDDNAFSIVGNNKEAFHSADVEIASKVSVTVIMQTAAYNGGFTVKLGGNEIKNVPYKEVTADYIAITVRDISAADLAKPIVVTLSDGTILTYSIPAYASRMLDKANDGERINDDLKVLVKALYAYAEAAAAVSAN